MNDYITENWLDFTEQDRKIAIELLSQIDRIEKEIYGKPTIVKNKNSGYIFLSDSDFNVWMLNELNVIEKWVYCPNCGCEGFISSFKESLKDDSFVRCNDCNEEF